MSASNDPTSLESQARAAIKDAGGDVHALLPHVLARLEEGDTNAALAVESLRRFPAHAAHFERQTTRESLRSPKRKADYIAAHGVRAYLALPQS